MLTEEEEARLFVEHYMFGSQEYEDYVHRRNAVWFREYIDSLSEEELERLRRSISQRHGKVDWKKEGF
jgi:hypothetical protein